MLSQELHNIECELSGTGIQTFSIHAERCVKVVTDRVNLHTDAVGIVAGGRAYSRG